MKYLISISLLAIVLRITRLTEGFWLDELLSAQFSRGPLWLIFEYDPHPPLYYLQLRPWTFLSTSEVWLHLNSVMWGVAAVLSLYYVTSRLYTIQIAQLATFLMAISPFAVWYSQELRMYAMLSCLAIWVLWFSSMTLSRGRWADVVSMGIAILAIVYSHGFGVLILVAAGVFAIGRWTRRWMIGYGGAVLLSIPWIVMATSIKPRGHPKTAVGLNIFRVFYKLLFGDGDAVVVVVVVAGLLLMLVVVRAVLQDDRRIVLSFLVAPILACAFMSFVYPVWIDRSLAIVSPFVPLAITLAYRSKGRHVLTAAFVTMFVLALGLQSFKPKQDFRAAALFVEQHAQAGETVTIPDPLTKLAWCWYGDCSIVQNEGLWLVYEYWQPYAAMPEEKIVFEKDFDGVFVQKLKE